MKTLFLSLLVFSGVAGAGTREQLQRIADNANIGNGYATVTTYNVDRFNKAKAITALNKEKSKGCSWQTLEYRREIIAAIKTEAYDEPVSIELQKMYEQNRIKAMIGILSDNEVSCSRFYVRLYTNDGYLLNLNYDGSD